MDESDDELEPMDVTPIAVVRLPEFDNKSWKAVLLGNTMILDVNLVGVLDVKVGYKALMVRGWDSILVDD